MTHVPLRRSALAIVCVAALSAGACNDDFETPVSPQFSVSRADAGPQPLGFEVYTQNVYLGGDTGPLFSLDLSDIPAVLQAVNVFWGQVQASDIPARASEFVDEIEERLPHVVALQEALRFLVLDAGFNPTGGIDILTAIEAEIALRDLPYETAVVQAATSSTLPLTPDFTTGGIAQWLNFTDRVVILRRTDVTVLDQAQGVYAATLPLGPVELVRGWARLTADHRGTPHHFITTHLEIQATGPIHDAQANELIGYVAANLDGVTIIAGDLNSDADAQPGAPSWTETYDKLIADGFTDVWQARPPGPRAAGPTCCYDPNLGDGVELDERIDFVLARSSDGGPNGLARGLFRIDVVGEEFGDRAANGLWPSDHAGLVANIRMRTGDTDPSDAPDGG